MTTALGGSAASISAQIRDAILASLPGAQVQVTPGSPGHFGISVRWAEFADKNRLTCQRLVYKAIAPLMSGDRAPVHAVDRLETSV
ncbi:MAG TPA: BolA/IbaG family iron-sulfur metabolism protein [Polyangiaceae bacterium]|nr:BolA/IbaG family iron-sulfur metabolism protein [Polyangiaceae bacterium]